MNLANMKKTFIFKTNNESNWRAINSRVVSHIGKLCKYCNEDFYVEINSLPDSAKENYQLKFFNGYVVPEIKKKMNEDGNNMDSDDVKDFLKRLPSVDFTKKYYSKSLDCNIDRVISCAKLSKSKMKHLIDESTKWAYDFYGIVIEKIEESKYANYFTND